MVKSDLIDRSMDCLEKMQLDTVTKAGIRRDPENYHITVMYPPLKAMDRINSEEIFHNFQSKSKEFTLYVHIPFCSGKCTFCYFYQVERPEASLVSRYISALKKEMKIIAENIGNELGDFKVKSIFFGGGSPTVLSEDQFQDLLQYIKRQFKILDDIEITVEIHPEIVRQNGRSLLECYSDSGVNRLNIGVQSFNDNILRITNRRHTAEEAIKVFNLAGEVGFENINIDLLYPLPDLTPEIWENTLNTAFTLKPESITSYFTAFKEASPIFKLFKNSPHRFPDEYVNHLLRIMTIEKAKEQGYNYRKLIDWFVKPRTDFHYEHQLNEVHKTDDVQLISVGSGVFSYLNHHQYYNYPDIKKYIESLQENELPVWKGIQLSKKERLARAMVLGMKSGVLNMENLGKQFDLKIFNHYKSKLQKLESLNLIEINNDEIILSKKGILFADEIAVQFITQDIKNKLIRSKKVIDFEASLIDNFNFMYEIDTIEG
jgi:oxygen-independent coproporphyrinogen-3 oxidase